MPRIEAIIRTADPRIRPVLLTSSTTMAGPGADVDCACPWTLSMVVFPSIAQPRYGGSNLQLQWSLGWE